MVERTDSKGKGARVIDIGPLIQARAFLAHAQRAEARHRASPRGATWWAAEVAREAVAGMQALVSAGDDPATAETRAALFDLFYWAGKEGVPTEWTSPDDARVIEALVDLRHGESKAAKRWPMS